jgi:hypothetical protein
LSDRHKGRANRIESPPITPPRRGFGFDADFTQQE